MLERAPQVYTQPDFRRSVPPTVKTQSKAITHSSIHMDQPPHDDALTSDRRRKQQRTALAVVKVRGTVLIHAGVQIHGRQLKQKARFRVILSAHVARNGVGQRFVFVHGDRGRDVFVAQTADVVPQILLQRTLARVEFFWGRRRDRPLFFGQRGVVFGGHGFDFQMQLPLRSFAPKPNGLYFRQRFGGGWVLFGRFARGRGPFVGKRREGDFYRGESTGGGFWHGEGCFETPAGQGETAPAGAGKVGHESTGGKGHVESLVVGGIGTNFQHQVSGDRGGGIVVGVGFAVVRPRFDETGCFECWDDVDRAGKHAGVIGRDFKCPDRFSTHHWVVEFGKRVRGGGGPVKRDQ